MNYTKYYISWVRFHQQDGYMLWIENPESECLWSNSLKRVPVFKIRERVVELAQQLNVELEKNDPHLVDLDIVVNWLVNTEKMPPKGLLSAWNLFSDLSQTTGEIFIGNIKAPVRNRVFDLLYVTNGLWRSDLPIVWPRHERKVLRRILQQGFRLWEKYTYEPNNTLE